MTAGVRLARTLGTKPTEAEADYIQEEARVREKGAGWHMSPEAERYHARALVEEAVALLGETDAEAVEAFLAERAALLEREAVRS